MINLCSPIVNVLSVGLDVTLYNFTLESLPVVPDPTAMSSYGWLLLIPVPTFALVNQQIIYHLMQHRHDNLELQLVEHYLVCQIQRDKDDLKFLQFLSY